MFSYIYADTNGGGRSAINYVAVATKIEKIQYAAISYMAGTLSSRIDYKDVCPAAKLFRNAVEKKDLDTAIKAWEQYSAQQLNTVVIQHGIQPIKLTE